MTARRTLAQVKDAMTRLAFAGVPAGERDPAAVAVVHALAREAYELGRREGNCEHIVQLTSAETADLRKWLEHPDGGFYQGRAAFEACGAGILVRTRPYQAGGEVYGLSRPAGGSRG